MFTATNCEMCNFLPVRSLIIVRSETEHYYIIGKFNDVIWWESIQRIEQRAEHTSLRSSGVDR